MMKRAGVVFMMCAACGSSPPPAPASPPPVDIATEIADAGPVVVDIPDAAPPPPADKLVVVTVVSAEIAGHMPNGDQWDGKDSKADSVDGPLALYLQRHPELEDTRSRLGVPIEAETLASEAETSPAADPMLLVQLKDRVYRSPVRTRAFRPTWDFSFQFVVGALGGEPGVAPTDTIRLQVVDYDGPTRFDTIGTDVMTVEELLSAPLHTRQPFGSVNKLTLEVAVVDLPPELPQPSVFRIAVPGNASWTDTGVEIVAGQRIEIDAADEVCTSREDLRQCGGPEGQKGDSEYNLPGFGPGAHGALVGAIGDTRFFVKRRRELIAPSSGRLRLGINDSKTSNNRGSFAVRVAVSPAP